MPTDRITYRLVTKDTPLRERYDALLIALEGLGFYIDLEDGREVFFTPSPEGLQLLRSRRDTFQETVDSFDDIILEYPDVPMIAEGNRS